MVLLILILVSILRTALNIAFRAIAVARVRSCGWWLTGTRWGLLLQGVVAFVQWTMAKRRAISGAVGRDMEDKKDRRGKTPALSRPTFYRKRIISQRKRENSRNRGQGLVCNLCYLFHVLCIDKQSPGAMQPALSPT